MDHSWPRIRFLLAAIELAGQEEKEGLKAEVQEEEVQEGHGGLKLGSSEEEEEREEVVVLGPSAGSPV